MRKDLPEDISSRFESHRKEFSTQLGSKVEVKYFLPALALFGLLLYIVYQNHCSFRDSTETKFESMEHRLSVLETKMDLLKGNSQSKLKN